MLDKLESNVNMKKPLVKNREPMVFNQMFIASQMMKDPQSNFEMIEDKLIEDTRNTKFI